MTCHELAERISILQPQLAAADVARLCLLILSLRDDSSELADEAALRRACNYASFRLEAATDQHAAVAEEFEAMCSEAPVQLSDDQLWTLMRVVKVQSQILDLYTGEPALT